MGIIIQVLEVIALAVNAFVLAAIVLSRGLV